MGIRVIGKGYSEAYEEGAKIVVVSEWLLVLVSGVFMSYVLAKNTDNYIEHPSVLLAVVPILCLWFYCVFSLLGII